MKIGPVGAELFHVDGQTNIYDEADSRFSKFCETADISPYLIKQSATKMYGESGSGPHIHTLCIRWS